MKMGQKPLDKSHYLPNDGNALSKSIDVHDVFIRKDKIRVFLSYLGCIILLTSILFSVFDKGLLGYYGLPLTITTCEAPHAAITSTSKPKHETKPEGTKYELNTLPERMLKKGLASTPRTRHLGKRGTRSTCGIVGTVNFLKSHGIGGERRNGS